MPVQPAETTAQPMRTEAIHEQHVPISLGRYLGDAAVAASMDQRVWIDDGIHGPLITGLVDLARRDAAAAKVRLDSTRQKGRQVHAGLMQAQYGGSVLPPFLRSLHDGNDALTVLSQTNRRGHYLVPTAQALNLLQWRNHNARASQERLVPKVEAKKQAYQQKVMAHAAELGLDQEILDKVGARLAETTVYEAESVKGVVHGHYNYYKRTVQGREISITRKGVATNSLDHEFGHALEGEPPEVSGQKTVAAQRGLLRIFGDTPEGILLQEATNELFTSVLQHGNPDAVHPTTQARQHDAYKQGLTQLDRLCHKGNVPIDPRLFIRALLLDDGPLFMQVAGQLKSQLAAAFPARLHT